MITPGGLLETLGGDFGYVTPDAEEEVCGCMTETLLPHRPPRAASEEGHLASGTLTL